MEVVNSEKQETKIINRQLLWMKHQEWQSFKDAYTSFYDKMGDTIQELEERRQEIVREFYEFDDDGVIKVNDQKQYILKKGKDIKNYDKKMEKLMSGYEKDLM